MKVGFFQFFPLLGKKEENVERAISSLRGARADLLVLPELFSTGYLFGSEEETKRSAEFIPDGPTFAKLAHAAAREKVNLVYGIAEKEGEKLFNSSVLVTPKGDFSVYRKLHLFNLEKLWFSPGDKELEVFDVDGVKVGMMICFDWIFPETARILALNGADIICHPSNLVLPHLCQKAMITRCVENGTFAITANRTGAEKKEELELSFTGMSQVVDPKGDVLAKADESSEGVWTVDIEPTMARSKKVTPRNHLLEDRRTEFYQKGDLC
ncbi:MAG: acyltransferase [Candidatus Zixiibacteriota bacterium]|nr:MAG: acyltransferase [candidate division Zixibacteria bacterium]